MMGQHLNSMLEHFKMSSFRRKNESSPNASPRKENEFEKTQNETKDDKYSEVVENKSKSLFKNLIPNENTNIFHSFMKTTDNNSGECVNLIKAKTNDVDSHKNDYCPSIINNAKTINESPQISNNKKRNSLQTNGDVRNRELSPSPRATHRKSSHDIRLRANQSLLDGDPLQSAILRPLKTKNIITKSEVFDTLHHRAIDVSINFLSSIFHLSCFSFHFHLQNTLYPLASDISLINYLISRKR